MSNCDEQLFSWEQQPGESAKAFEAFTAYRDMGADRSTRKVAQKLTKSDSVIRKWSSTYNWVERARAYDRDLDRQAHEQAVHNVQQMNDRHIQMAMQLQEKASAALENLAAANLTPRMILDFITKATELERMCRLYEAGMDWDNQQKDGNSEVEIIIESNGRE
ncbi:MAG: hypothetical protein PUC00_10355 [Clostridiales bacterium]|nr:hypothetical protein [Clostridiales bacterium]